MDKRNTRKSEHWRRFFDAARENCADKSEAITDGTLRKIVTAPSVPMDKPEKEKESPPR